MWSAVGFALVLAAALGFSPLGGETVVYVLGYGIAALAHGALAVLTVGLLLDLIHRDWTDLERPHHIVMAVLAMLLAAGLVFMDRWVVDIKLSTTSLTVYFALAATVAVGCGVLTWQLLDVRKLNEGEEYLAVTVGDAALGVVAGAAAMVLVVAASAYVRQQTTPTVAIPTVTVPAIDGQYLALGDSYSAGEGLRPFNFGTAMDCHRSQSAYSQELIFTGLSPAQRFAACSGAVVADVYKGFGRPAQVDGKVHPEVGLVTMTMSGNDFLFSKVVVACFEDRNCLKAVFRSPPRDPTGRYIDYPPSQPLPTWASATARILNGRILTLYGKLHHDYPRARIVVIGYPYLFPTGAAPYWPNDCASILRRFGRAERDGIRSLMDSVNNMLYADAVQTGLEFISPAYGWSGHEPCGPKGQYTNSIKPILQKNPIDGGTFHPNANGQRELAYLVSCYLKTYQVAPSPFIGGSRRKVSATGLIGSLSTLGLRPPPGSMQAPLRCS